MQPSQFVDFHLALLLSVFPHFPPHFPQLFALRNGGLSTGYICPTISVVDSTYRLELEKV